MKTRSNRELINNIKLKNIDFEYGDSSIFRKYSYFQTINAYKSLFVDDVEDIEKIENNINMSLMIPEYVSYYKIGNYTGNQDLLLKVYRKICKKYGIDYDRGDATTTLKAKIKKISYVHHTYLTGTKYKDFIRMYKFEHELRSVLLKYSLIVEENVKNIFVRVLNDYNEINADYLTNISSYNTNMNTKSALKTLKLIVDKHGNHHSMPIKRKQKQNLTIPYWTLINELAMNQTYHAINNLLPEMSKEVFQSCLNYFTLLDVDIKSHTVGSRGYNDAMNHINVFKSILSYIGEFRNMLAHNQPIFSYNVKDYCLKSFPNITYLKPNKDTLSDQYALNAALMIKLELFFGSDRFNRNHYNRNIDLSVMIYLIYKVIKNIDPNTKFYDEIRDLYKRYNILITEYEYKVDKISDLETLLNEIQDIDENSIDLDGYFNKIENNIAYKRDLRSENKVIQDKIGEVKRLSKKINIMRIPSKYPTFPRNIRYTDYTGIDVSFFTKIV